MKRCEAIICQIICKWCETGRRERQEEGDYCETYLETLDYDRILVIEGTCCVLILNRSYVLLQLAAHDHDLPLDAILWHPTILAAAGAPHLQKLRLVLRLDHKQLRAETLTFKNGLVTDVIRITLKLSDEIVSQVRYHSIVLLESPTSIISYCSNTLSSYIRGAITSLLAWLSWWRIWLFFEPWLMKVFIDVDADCVRMLF